MHERGAAEPILPLKLWRDRVICVGSFSGFTGGVVMMSINAFLPLYVQGAMGRSPTAAGLALGAASVSWTFASLAAGRLMIRTSYRRAAMIGGFADRRRLGAGDPQSGDGLLWAAAGSLLIGIGMGFCNTAFLVSTQASVGWNQRGAATSSIMFMRIVGNSVGAAVFGAVLNFGVSHRVPEAGDAVNRLLQPAARGGARRRRDRPGQRCDRAGLQNVYIVAAVVAIVSLVLAWALPARLSPTRPALTPRQLTVGSWLRRRSCRPGRRRGGSKTRVEDHLGPLLGDHDRRRIGVAGDDRRHDRGVDDPQPFDAVNPQLGVDNGSLIGAHMQVPVGW